MRLYLAGLEGCLAESKYHIDIPSNSYILTSFYYVKDNVIKDICFDGEACAISISSTSIMIKNLIGKSVKEAKDYINNFINMVNEKNYDKDILNEAYVYEDIYKQSSRKTCATLPYRGILKVLEKYE